VSKNSQQKQTQEPDTEEIMTKFEERKNMTIEQHFDQARAEAFAGRLLDLLNSGALALMTSIGHRTGLFDAMAGLPPSTTEQISSAANLNKRYVREWLGAMTVGGIVEHDPQDGTYYLPQEHSSFLTRAASPNNIAAFTQFISVLGSVEDGIVESFKEGGGLPYSAYPRFHEVMAEVSDQTVVAPLTDHILPLVPGLTERLESGIDVLDVGSGSGKAMNLLARKFPNSRFAGYDISGEAIAHARAEAQAHGITNVRFEVKDAAALDEEASYDLITTFDAIHDQAKPGAVLKGIADALKDDGVYLMQDIAGSSHVHNNMDHPLGPFIYTISTTHCMTVSLAQGGEGLGTMWGEEKAKEMLEEAGFTKVEVNQLPHDPFNNYFIITKG
jgi:2-polyprenyl-3-methyl-5-hydroxy-6-metoxy-1,4-benzoquinol methylase